MSSERVFEVFVRAAGQHAQHAGSVVATGHDAALVFAHEQFGRRGSWHEIWVAPRDQIAVMEASEVPGPTFDRSYRALEGYKHVERRWREIDLAGERKREGLRS